MALVERLKIRLFQPTLPARGATWDSGAEIPAYY